jgi:replicative DNA helicase
VIFIHREEMYRRGTEDEGAKSAEGIAEIIIGKQRNGPVGDVKLAFLKQYATFENLATGYDE